MLKKLFSSKTRVEVLKLFLFNPDDSFYQRQISSLTYQRIRGVQREVIKLVKIGIIEKSIQGNRLYYRINKKCPVFEELKSIFFKCEGISKVLQLNLAKTNSIKVAFIYGSYAKGEENLLSDIDLMVIGSITSKELSIILSKTKKEIMRPINFMVISQKEFKEKTRNKDHFLNAVLKEKKIFIIGDENELKAIVKSRSTKTSQNL
jgi:predicted nucleotidyltransferase